MLLDSSDVLMQVNGKNNNNALDALILEDSVKNKKYELKEVLNKVIWGDALKILDKLPPESVDMVFIDPPYFLQLPKKTLIRWNVKTKVDAVTDDWDKFNTFEEYDNFLVNLLSAVKRVMKPSATTWVIGTYHNIFRIGKLMQDLGFWILNNVIWVTSSPG